MKKKYGILLSFFLVLFAAVLINGTSASAAASMRESLTLKNTRTYTLKVTGTTKTVTFSVDDPSIATVSSKGKVKAKSNGVTYVRAKVGKKTLTCKVTVKSPTKPTKVKLNKTSLTLKVGGTSTLTATVKPTGIKDSSVTWKSSNKKVATVTKNGKVKAKKTGTATITATTSNGKKATCKVKVKKASVTASSVSKLSVAKTAKKIIVVSTDSTTTSKAKLQYFKKSGGKWKQVLSCDAYVGKNGINKTKEGDMKTPTGLYHFTKLMGIAKNPGTILSYHRIDSNDYWCGGKNYYNQFVDEDKQKHNCSKTNDEHLIEYTTAYQYLAALDYNSENVYGKGSAIFLHCRTANNYTAGCIAVDKSVMKKLMKKIDSNTVIIIDKASRITNKYY